jgi:4-carboxymuconolactone decarboxylase
MQSALWVIRIALVCVVSVNALTAAGNVSGPLATDVPFVRPAVPRILPLPPGEFTATHVEALGPFGKAGRTSEFFQTCLRNVDLCRSWVPITYYLGLASTLSRRDKELLLLRSAVLCRDDFVWSEHAQGPSRQVLSDEEIARVAKGPDEDGWSVADAALLRAADELYFTKSIDNETWQMLAARYEVAQLVDVIFTVGHYTATSMYLNTAAVVLKPEFKGLPKGAVRRSRFPSTVSTASLKARIPPLEPREWTEAHRAALGGEAAGGATMGLYKTCLQSVNLCKAWLTFTAHVDGATSTLAPRDRELLILRTACLSRDSYTWAAHRGQAARAGLTEAEIRRIDVAPDSKAWTRSDRTLLRLADELNGNQFVTDVTWRELSGRYRENVLLDAVLTVGHYSAVAMFVNAVGVPLEPGWRGLR